MSKEHSIAIDTISLLIYSRSFFTYEEACQKIRKNGGILRVSIGVTIGNYLKNLEELGVLKSVFVDKKHGYVGIS